MVRKKREREENDPAKATQFKLHGVEVPATTIARFESREGRNKGISGRQGDAPTPPGLACRTPPTTTCDSAASDDRSLIRTQLVPRDFMASMQTIQPRLTIRSPSLESFDWFKEYIDYSKSINGSPTTSENPLMEMLLRFQKVLDDYENERAYKSIAEGLHPEHPCHYYRILNTISALPYGLGDAGEKVTPMTIENWAQASVKEAIQFNGRNSLFMAMVGEAVGEVYIALGRLWEAKIYLEQTILEMKRLDTPLYARKEVTLSLARCYSELGNIQQADDLLKVLFKTEYPKIVASSYFYLEKYCQECRVRLLKRCYSKAKDDLVKYVNATVGYEWEEDDEFPAYDWEEDDMELGIRVAAAELIRKFNPGIMERMRGCDDNGFECSGAANDELDDELDEDMQWDGQ